MSFWRAELLKLLGRIKEVEIAAFNVASRATLKGYSPKTTYSVYLTETGREGVFVWTLGNFAARIAADPEEGIYIKADDTPSTTGAWVRQHDGWEFAIEWFGGKKGDVTFDNKAAFDAAIALMTTLNVGCLRFQNGEYEFLTRPAPITVGILLKGGGESSSLLHGGTVLMRNFDGDIFGGQGFMSWDGTGIAFNSTGGGMQGITLLAAEGTTGGSAIRLFATDDDNRPGYMSFRDVQIGGYVDGTWVQCIEINGQNCVTAGGQGLRDTYLSNVWCSGATSSTVILVNATQTSLDGVNVVTGSGSVASMFITGISTNAIDSSLGVTGKVWIAGDLVFVNAGNCSLVGRASTVTMEAGADSCMFVGMVDTTITNNSASSRILTQSRNLLSTQGSATYNPPSLADGVGTTTTVACTGAALGDFAHASFSLDLQGITLTAWVSSANVVSVRFQNESGGVLDLASGTLKVGVQ